MKDFFRVMGKAFAMVFGSTSALALVLVLLALALRPLLRSQLQAQQETLVGSQAGPRMARPIIPDGKQKQYLDEQGNPIGSAGAAKTYLDEQGNPIGGAPDFIPWNPKRCTSLPNDVPAGFLIDSRLEICDKNGCQVYLPSLRCSVAYVSRTEITKAQWVPVK